MNYYDTIRACLPFFRRRRRECPMNLPGWMLPMHFSPSTRSCRELCSCHRYLPRFSTINLILRTHATNVNEMWMGSIMRAISSVDHLLARQRDEEFRSVVLQVFQKFKSRSKRHCLYLLSVTNPLGTRSSFIVYWALLLIFDLWIFVGKCTFNNRHIRVI